MSNENAIGNNLRILRQYWNLSLEDLSSLGIPLSKLEAIERGEYVPSAMELGLLADGLLVPFGALLRPLERTPKGLVYRERGEPSVFLHHSRKPYRSLDTAHPLVRHATIFCTEFVDDYVELFGLPSEPLWCRYRLPDEVNELVVDHELLPVMVYRGTWFPEYPDFVLKNIRQAVLSERLSPGQAADILGWDYTSVLDLLR